MPLYFTTKLCCGKKRCCQLDITRTPLYEIHVCHYLWFDAIMMATYLHNHLPSSLLGNGILLYCLFHDATLFLYHLASLGVWLSFKTILHLSLSLLFKRKKEFLLVILALRTDFMFTSLIYGDVLPVLMSPFMRMFLLFSSTLLSVMGVFLQPWFNYYYTFHLFPLSCLCSLHATQCLVQQMLIL